MMADRDSQLPEALPPIGPTLCQRRLINAAVAECMVTVGIPVHPIRAKRPVTKHGLKDATLDREQIAAWRREGPDSYWSAITGPVSGYWVLDVDGPEGRSSLKDLSRRLRLDLLASTRVIVTSPSGGLHLWYRLRPGDDPRSRASDIAPGLDTKGRGGSITAPGSICEDGGRYRLIGTSLDVSDAAFAPRGLLYAATFNATDRAVVKANRKLQQELQAAEPTQWQRLVDAHRAAQCPKFDSSRVDETAMGRQARSDVADAAAEFASLTDGRRDGAFRLAAKVGKYVALGAIPAGEFVAAFVAAAAANGALSKHGQRFILNSVANAIRKAANDPPPRIAREFRGAP